MRSAKHDHGDRTAKAVIRDEALRLFAAHGAAAVSLRRVAASAAVSPGLAVHHFGSKVGLLEAVNTHVAGVFDTLFAAVDDAAWSTVAGASFAGAIVAHMPADSAIPAYLRRLLLDGDPAGHALFARWYGASRQVLDQLTASGVMHASTDPPVRAAFLMVNDLAVFLLRDQLAGVLDIDPLTHNGMTRWADVVLAVYRDGLFSLKGAT